MPRFHNKRPDDKERTLRLSQDVISRPLAIFICKRAQDKLDCYGRYDVDENDAEIVVKFTGEGADQLFENVHNWCQGIIEISLGIKQNIAEAICNNIIYNGIDAYTFYQTIVNEDDSEEEVVNIFGTDATKLADEFEKMQQKYIDDWSKSQLVIKSAINIEGAEALISQIQTNYAFIAASKPDDEKFQRFSSVITVFGDAKAELLDIYRIAFNKFVFEDTPLVLAIILMGKTETKMTFEETKVVSNGRSTVIIPCSDDEEKNTKFYNELFSLRSRCIEKEVETSSREMNSVHTICKEIDSKSGNVFHFITAGKVILRGIRDDVESYKATLKERLRTADTVRTETNRKFQEQARRFRASAHY